MDIKDLKVGDHVTYDWDGPSQGIVTAIESDGVTVKDVPDSRREWIKFPMDYATETIQKGHLEKVVDQVHGLTITRYKHVND